jgi:CxxC-x17-CxxC domain-containing protein
MEALTHDAAHDHSSQRFRRDRFAEAATEGVFSLYGTSTNTNDRTLTCADCGQAFTFTASEQQFYADRQFSEPRRCATCRAARKASRGDAGNAGYGDSGSTSHGYDAGPREMFSATCSTCGREARVPFRPSGAKPVYCSDCFTPQRRSY